MEQDFQDIAQQSWQQSTNRPFSHKTCFLAADIKKWCRKKPKNNDQLATIEAQILAQYSLHPSNQDHTTTSTSRTTPISPCQRRSLSHSKSQKAMGC
jgi:hypothetical protein